MEIELTNMPQQSATDQSEAMKIALTNMTPKELIEMVTFYIESTDVIMEGIGMAEKLNLGEATLTSALLRTRDGLEKVVEWIGIHFNIPTEEEMEEEEDLVLHSDVL